MDKNKGKYSKSSTDTPTAKYTTQACDFCKQRHLRCNGEIPCQQCLKRNQSCQFTQVNYKRGPKPRTKGKSPKKDRERDRDSNREEPQWRAKSLETDSPGYGRVFGAGGYSNAPELVADPGSEYRDTAMHYHDDSHPAYYSPSEDSHEAYQPHNTRGHPHPGEPRYQFSSLSNAGTSPMYDNPPRHGNAPLRSHKDSYPDSDYDYRNPNSTSPNYTRYPTYPVTASVHRTEHLSAMDVSHLGSRRVELTLDQISSRSQHIEEDQPPLNALYAFMKHIHPLCPNNFVISTRDAKFMWDELMKISSGTLRYDKLEQWMNGFVYTVVFCTGCRVILRGEADIFANVAEMIMQHMFFSKEKLDPINFSTHADQLVSCITLYGSYLMEGSDFNSARLCFSQAFNLHNIHVNQISPSVSHRLYAHLAGMSRNIPDMSHWVLDSHLLGPAANTPVNRVILCCLYCSPCMLRDPHNKPLPTGLYIPPSQEQISYNDSILYREMLDEVNETMDMVWQCESSTTPDPPEYILAYNTMIYGCRAYVMAHCGMSKAASESASKAISYALALGNRILFWAVPLGLSYALQVLRDQTTFDDGYKLLMEFSHYYPFVQRIIPILEGTLSDENSSDIETSLHYPSIPQGQQLRQRPQIQNQGPAQPHLAQPVQQPYYPPTTATQTQIQPTHQPPSQPLQQQSSTPNQYFSYPQTSYASQPPSYQQSPQTHPPYSHPLPSHQPHPQSHPSHQPLHPPTHQQSHQHQAYPQTSQNPQQYSHYMYK